MPAEFLVLNAKLFSPPTSRPVNLLGMGLEERARAMLSFSGLRPAQGLQGKNDLILYPGEVVGPARLGYEVAAARTAEGEILALIPRHGGRPVVRISRTLRNQFLSAKEDPETAYARAVAAATRRMPLRMPAVPVVDPATRREARRVLLGSLRKSVDGLVSRTMNRPISIAISSVLVHTPITPNALSFLTFVMALGAAALMAAQAFAAGAVLMQFSSILDGCDGEVARLKYRASKVGAWLDTVLDDISTPVFILATGYGVWQAFGGTFGSTMFGLAVTAVVLTLPGYWLTYSRLLAHGSTDSGRVSFSETPGASWFRRFLVTYLRPFSKRDGYYLIFMLVALAGLPWMIVILFFIGATLVVGTILTDRTPSDARYGTTQQHRPVLTTSSRIETSR